MSKKVLPGFILLLTLLTAVTVACKGEKNPLPVSDGPRIRIDAQGHKIEGMLEIVEEYHFLLKDEGKSMGTFSGDAFVTMIPLKTAEDLRAQYGDFFTCNQPGAVQARQAIQAVVLVGGSREAQQSVADAMVLVRKSHIPVVRFRGGRLLVGKQTYRGMTVQDNTGIPIYYVNDFKIVTPHFPHSK